MASEYVNRWGVTIRKGDVITARYVRAAGTFTGVVERILTRGNYVKAYGPHVKLRDMGMVSCDDVVHVHTQGEG